MVGITLSPEQIRSAPPEVRQWLEHEIAASLGLNARGPEPAAAAAEHLVAFDDAEALAVLSLIQGMLPAVNVFFELGRKGEMTGQDGLEALRLADMLRHTHLQNVDQVVSCLKIINNAARQVRQDGEATVYLIDPRGYCLVAAQTQQSIFRIWQQIIGRHELPMQQPAAPIARGDGMAVPAFGLSGVVPPAAAHLGGFAPAEPSGLMRSAQDMGATRPG